MKISCNDALSGLNTISGTIDNVSVNGSNGILEISPQTLQFISSQNNSLFADIHCSDNVGNLANYNFSFIVDTQYRILVFKQPDTGTESAPLRTGKYTQPLQIITVIHLLNFKVMEFGKLTQQT